MSENQDRRSRSKAKNVFGEELEVLTESRAFLSKEDFTLDQCKDQLAHLASSYDELLDQAKLITKVSDRLQNKINKTNDELADKNIQLQDSLDALTKAKVGRKAVTITLIVVVVLFLFTEAFVEPIIEDWALNAFPPQDPSSNFTVATVLALLSKGLIALSLRPIEKIVEKRLMRQEAEKILAEKKTVSKSKSTRFQPT